MALQKQTMSFPFSKGLNEKDSDKARGPDSLTQAKNVRFEKTGELRKREGFDQLSNSKTGSGSVSNGVAISQYKDETLVFDGAKLHTKLSNDKYLTKGTYVPCTFKNEFRRRDPDKKQSNAQMAEKNGVRVYTWMEYDHSSDSKLYVKVTVEDVATGATLADDITLSTVRFRTSGNDRLYATQKPFAIVAGTRIFVLWTSNPGIPATISLTTGGTGYAVTGGGAESATYGGSGSGLTVDIDAIGGSDAITTIDTTPGTPGAGYTVGDTVSVAGGDNNASVTVATVGTSQLLYSAIDCTSIDTAAAYTGAAVEMLDADGGAIAVNSAYTLFSADRLVNDTYSDNIVIAYTDNNATYEYVIHPVNVSSNTLTAVTLSSSYRIPVSSRTGLPNRYNSPSSKYASGKNIISNIMLKSLNDGSSSSGDYNVIFGATFDKGAEAGGSDTGVPVVVLYNIRDDFGAAIRYTGIEKGPGKQALYDSGIHLLNGTAGTAADGGAVYVVLELWGKDQKGIVEGDEGTVPPHFVASYKLTRGATGADPDTTHVLVAHNASVLSDMFRHTAASQAGLYYALSQVNDRSLISDDKHSYGLSNNLALMRNYDDSGTVTNEFVGAVKTGRVANCLTSEYAQSYDPEQLSAEYTTTGNITVGNASVTITDLGPIQVGWTIKGDGIAASTTVTAIQSGFLITMSNNAATPTSGGTEDIELSFSLTSNTRVEIRPMVYGVQRVTSTDSGERFIFGAARFAGYTRARKGQYSRPTTADNIFAISLVETDFDPDRTLASLDIDGTWAGTGGYLHGYDGNEVFELGFALYPSIVRLKEYHTDLTNKGGLSAGTYKYIAVYEWTDENGNIHRSATSNFSEITTTAVSGKHSTVMVEVYTLSFTRKTGVKVKIFRTEIDGTVFYEAGSVALHPPSGAAHGWASFHDWPRGDSNGSTENDIIYREEVYTADGEKNNGFVGSCTDIVRHRDRVMVTASDDTIHYSKPLIDGSEPQFPDSFRTLLPADSSRVTTIESNLDHFLIFTEDHGFFISGEGPDRLGGGGFTSPRLFASGQGARRGAAHVDTPVGVFIQSHRGIYLIGRNLSVKYIGAQVEDISSNLMINADLSDSTNEVRLMLSKEGTAGPADDQYLIYNYYFNQWTEWTVNYDSSAWQVGEVYDGSNYIRLTADGKTFKQTAGLFQDDNTSGSAANYSVTLVTTPIAPGGLMQAHRIYRFMLLGDYVSDHTLTLGAKYDYSTSTTTTFVESITSANDGPFIIRAHLDKQKCRAIQLNITIAGSGECVRLDGLAFEVGKKKSTFKLESARTA